jgi:hypothetical protein
MNTALKLSLASVALVGGTVLVTAAALHPQDKPAGSQDKPAAGGMDGMDPEMMAKMMKLATPGPEHKELMKMAGQWEEDYKMRMSPDMDWMEFKGTSESKPLLGGRYIMMTTKFSMMGMPMEGFQILGYDNMKQEYTSFWADSMSTWWVTSRGKKDANGTIDLKARWSTSPANVPSAW